MKSAQGSDLALFFGDWSEIVKFSEIKPPLPMLLHTIQNQIENGVRSIFCENEKFNDLNFKHFS